MTALRSLVVFASIALVAAGALVLGDQARLAVKAAVARALIEASCDELLAGGPARPPWPWADHRPVGRLVVPRLSVRVAVLSGATGASLAFGPGHVDGTSELNGEGHSVIAGHRDTSFAFLARVRVGDRVEVVTPGERVAYEVVETRVVEADDASVLAVSAGRRLTLVTCHPFGGLAPSRGRFVAVALPVDSSS